jgi:hypothetical protein
MGWSGWLWPGYGPMAWKKNNEDKQKAFKPMGQALDKRVWRYDWIYKIGLVFWENFTGKTNTCLGAEHHDVLRFSFRQIYKGLDSQSTGSINQ